jgi:hypothetical protein
VAGPTSASVIRLVAFFVAVGVFLAGCRQDPIDTRLQEITARQQAYAVRQQAYAEHRLQQQRALYAKAAELRTKILNGTLPPDTKAAELEKIQGILDDYEREQREAEREAREQDMIDAQRDLSDAIRGLSDEIEEGRY